MPTPENRPTQPLLEIDPIHEHFRVGKYYICKLLGEGHFSAVWSVVTREGGLFAMKIVDRVHGFTNMDARISFEVELMERLEHPSIIRYRDMLVSDHHVYIVTDLYHSGDLSWMIELHHRLSVIRARMYFQDLIVGIHHLHRHGIAHRDIKPANLMVDDSGRVRLSDFGLADYPDANGNFHKALGTPAFMAPETWGRCPYNGFAADVWACACVLYNMLAGVPPFRSNSLRDMWERIKDGNFHKLPPEVRLDTRLFLRELFEVDPAKRITIDQILVHPWFVVGFDRSRLGTVTEETPVERF